MLLPQKRARHTVLCKQYSPTCLICTSKRQQIVLALVRPVLHTSPVGRRAGWIESNRMVNGNVLSGRLQESRSHGPWA